MFTFNHNRIQLYIVVTWFRLPASDQWSRVFDAHKLPAKARLLNWPNRKMGNSPSRKTITKRVWAPWAAGDAVQVRPCGEDNSTDKQQTCAKISTLTYIDCHNMDKFSTIQWPAGEHCRWSDSFRDLSNRIDHFHRGAIVGQTQVSRYTNCGSFTSMCKDTGHMLKWRLPMQPATLKSRPIISIVKDPFFYPTMMPVKKVYGRFTFRHLADVLNPKGLRAILDPCHSGAGPLSQGYRQVSDRHRGWNPQSFGWKLNTLTIRLYHIDLYIMQPRLAIVTLH